METSQEISKLTAALVKFGGKVGKVYKATKGQTGNQTYMYATLGDVLDQAKPVLAEFDLTVVQCFSGTELSTTVFHGGSGQFIRTSCQMHVANWNDPKQVGSAITYMRRYSIACVLNLNIDSDDDGDSASRAAAKSPAQNPLPLSAAQKTTKPALVKHTPDGEIDKNWARIAGLARTGQDPTRIREKYEVSQDLYDELMGIFKYHYAQQQPKNETQRKD
jgi:hypothetical protein